VQPLLIAGAGGFARETAAAVRAVNAVAPRFELLGFLDDAAQLHGSTVAGLRVLGPLDAIEEYQGASVVVCVGRSDNYFSRKRIVGRLALAPDRYATIVHPAAVVAHSTSLGPGSVLLAGVVTTADVTVGAHVAVMPGVVLTHDDVVGDYATLASGVRLGGNVVVEEGAYIGAGACVREERTVGAWALVGMGAVVTRDVPRREVWAGVPARRRRTVEFPSGWESTSR
jgi:sugar O-acyltransferase (sialic acid O-acetyltransferase NeuD family)